MDAIIRLRSGQLRKYRAMANIGTDSALADRMGLHRASVSRVLRGDAELSARFIACLLGVFKHLSFDDLFECVTDDETELADDDHHDPHPTAVAS